MSEVKDVAKDVAATVVKKKIMTIVFSSLSIALPFFLIIFTVFVSVFIVLGLFDKDDINGNSGFGYGGSSESGSFTISSTLLTKEEFSVQLGDAVSKYPSLQIFAENAYDIYDIALSEGVNPELVVVRAIKEGFSPGTYHNYWGMGCTNTGQGLDCRKYDTFNDGVRGFVSNVSKYSTLLEMMSRYAYIGDYWYSVQHTSSGAINWGIGGCAYKDAIYNPVPDRVQNACSTYTLCTPSITTNCVATNDEDQMAYATWQVNGMLEIRNSIFDVKVPANDYNDGGITATNIMAMNDRQVWYALTGYNSSDEANKYVTKNFMDSRMVTISVPIRTWSSNDSNNYSTKRSMIKLSVNKELASLFSNFFNDLYNETGSGDDLFVINPSEIGCYNYRESTGGGRLSAHAYGAACDINWNTNGNGYGEHVYTKSEWLDLKKSKSKYQILYKNSKAVEVMHRYTLSWGGEWNNVTDAMHFSFIGDDTRAFLQSRS